MTINTMKSPPLSPGASSPVSYTCTCPSPTPGLVLLFYRYFTSPPALPLPCPPPPSTLSTFHSALARSLHLAGKIRVSAEGFNVTVAGPRAAVHAYITACGAHWSFAGLPLSTPAAREAFFKPSPGCACVFGGVLSVRETHEITPMGVTGYVPAWDAVRRLSPAEFHARCWSAGSRVLVDVRNHYESRIGYFVDPRSGEPARRPGIRRFAQWPAWVRRWVREEGAADGEGNGEGEREILAYCTGGIRCEKATRWMVERGGVREGDRVAALEGGIAGYLMWMDEEIREGRKTPEDSLFKGRNYVFDARGSTGLEGGSGMPVANCHACGVPEDRLSKCRSEGCHLDLVVCSSCEAGDPRCCQNCKELDTASGESGYDGPRPICLCEMERETQLWGEDYFKRSKTKGAKRGGKSSGGISIQIKTIN